MLLNCGVGEDSWESLGLQGDPTSPFYRKSVLNIHWKDWCWSWNSNTLATWCQELTHWKRPWCWGRLKVGGEGDDRGGDDWMASPTPWTWVWTSSGSWWWTGRPGVLQSMGLQRVGHDWATALNLVFSGSIRMFFWLSAPPPALPCQMLVPSPAVRQWPPLLTPREKAFSRCLWSVCYLSGLYQGWETVWKKDPVLVILKLTL